MRRCSEKWVPRYFFSRNDTESSLSRQKKVSEQVRRRMTMKKFVFGVFMALALNWSSAFAVAVLGPDQALTAGTGIYSPNGQYGFVLQTDGNLVLYGPTGALWQTKTVGSGAQRAVMQGDGNFVLYRADNSVVWATRTSRPGTWLQVQDDGNFAMYWARAVWASNTADPQNIQSNETRVLTGGNVLTAGQSVSLAQYMLIFQADGNLVLYKNGGNPIWATNTHGRGASTATMQGDGNFVVSAGSTALWASGTYGNPGSLFALQPDGNLVIYTPTVIYDGIDGPFHPDYKDHRGPGRGICIGVCSGTAISIPF
jgi:hypothetical protein